MRNRGKQLGSYTHTTLAIFTCLHPLHSTPHNSTTTWPTHMQFGLLEPPLQALYCHAFSTGSTAPARQTGGLFTHLITTPSLVGLPALPHSTQPQPAHAAAHSRQAQLRGPITKQQPAQSKLWVQSYGGWPIHPPNGMGLLLNPNQLVPKNPKVVDPKVPTLMDPN